MVGLGACPPEKRYNLRRSNIDLQLLLSPIKSQTVMEYKCNCIQVTLAVR